MQTTWACSGAGTARGTNNNIIIYPSLTSPLEFSVTFKTQHLDIIASSPGQTIKHTFLHVDVKKEKLYPSTYMSGKESYNKVSLVKCNHIIT